MARRKFPFVRLHILFPRHPKVAALSDAAFRAQVSALCYCQEAETDGFVVEQVAASFAKPRVTAELVRAGIWEEADGGWLIHDYLEWNDSKAEIADRREARAMAGAMGAATRWDSKDDGKRHGVSHVRSDTDNATGSDALEVRRAEPPIQVSRSDFDAFWAVYPRRQGKIAAEKAFRVACRRVDAAVVIAAAERLRDDPNREPEFTPLPATWLNQGRWEDDPLPARNGHLSPTDRLARQAMEVLRGGR